MADEIDHRHLRRTAHNRPRAIEEAHKLAPLPFRALSIQRSEARHASHCCQMLKSGEHWARLAGPASAKVVRHGCGLHNFRKDRIFGI